MKNITNMYLLFLYLAPIFDNSRKARKWQASKSHLQTTAIQRHVSPDDTLIHHYIFLAGQDYTGPSGVAYIGTPCFRKTNSKIIILYI